MGIIFAREVVKLVDTFFENPPRVVLLPSSSSLECPKDRFLDATACLESMLTANNTPHITNPRNSPTVTSTLHSLPTDAALRLSALANVLVKEYETDSSIDT